MACFWTDFVGCEEDCAVVPPPVEALNLLTWSINGSGSSCTFETPDAFGDIGEKTLSADGSIGPLSQSMTLSMPCIAVRRESQPSCISGEIFWQVGISFKPPSSPPGWDWAGGYNIAHFTMSARLKSGYATVSELTLNGNVLGHAPSDGSDWTLGNDYGFLPPGSGADLSSVDSIEVTINYTGGATAGTNVDVDSFEIAAVAKVLG